MAFMQPQYSEATPDCPFYSVETTHGNEVVPGDVVGTPATLETLAEYCEGTPQSFEILTKGYFWRLSAPGYMDATEWTGAFETLADAQRDCSETYEIDPETGDDLESEE